MEGHGVWRTSTTPCQPGIHYKRLDLLCVCGADGNWPNPVCRDVFRVLHPVELSEVKQLENRESCFPTNVYAIDCNVCVCPSFGRFSSEYCTNRTCVNSTEAAVVEMRNHNQDHFIEVYAECSPSAKYKIDSQQCTCVTNNRLICDPPSSDLIKPNIPAQVCRNKKPNEIFSQDCNLCFCAEGKVICTINFCLHNLKPTILKYLKGEIGKLKRNFAKSNKKTNLEECFPGTKYNIECNKCVCYYNEKGIKTFTCTKKTCNSMYPLELIQTSCVVGTEYKKHCQTCSCVKTEGVIWERCTEDISCFPAIQNYKDVEMLNGQCDPLQTYTKGCNECQCINRKVISCTDHRCKGKEDELVEILPIVANYEEDCPTGHSYQLGCNYCYCLSDGNAVCTNIECDVNLVST